MKYGSPIDLAQSELQNAVIQNLASDPGSPLEGQMWYNTTTHSLRLRRNGVTWDSADALARANHTGTQLAATISDFNSAVDARTSLLAPLASPALTGTPTAPTAAPGTNSTQIATAAFVKAAIDALVAGAPGALDTLLEIANQLASDESAVSALTATVATKVPQTRTVNGLALSADITITRAMLSATGKYTATIGDGTSTSITITQATHGLAANGTNAVFLYDAITGAQVLCNVTVAPATGNVTLAFTVAPTANQYRVVIVG